jgi:hypothetical protein
MRGGGLCVLPRTITDQTFATTLSGLLGHSAMLGGSTEEIRHNRYLLTPLFRDDPGEGQSGPEQGADGRFSRRTFSTTLCWTPECKLCSKQSATIATETRHGSIILIRPPHRKGRRDVTSVRELEQKPQNFRMAADHDRRDAKGDTLEFERPFDRVRRSVHGFESLRPHTGCNSG